MDIGKKYQLVATPLNIVVLKRKPESEGFREVAYLPDLKSTLKWLVTQEVLDTQLKDLKSVVKTIEELREHIDAIPFQVTIERRSDMRGRVAKGDSEVSSDLSEPEVEEEDNEAIGYSPNKDENDED